MFNKRKYVKKNNKMILHKVRKRWLVISLAIFGLLGGSALTANAQHVNADVTNNSNGNADYQVSSNNFNNQCTLEDPQQNNGSAENISNDESNYNVNDIQEQSNQLHNSIINNAENNDGYISGVTEPQYYPNAIQRAEHHYHSVNHGTFSDIYPTQSDVKNDINKSDGSGVQPIKINHKNPGNINPLIPNSPFKPQSNNSDIPEGKLTNNIYASSDVTNPKYEQINPQIVEPAANSDVIPNSLPSSDQPLNGPSDNTNSDNWYNNYFNGNYNNNNLGATSDGQLNGNPDNVSDDSLDNNYNDNSDDDWYNPSIDSDDQSNQDFDSPSNFENYSDQSYLNENSDINSDLNNINSDINNLNDWFNNY